MVGEVVDLGLVNGGIIAVEEEGVDDGAGGGDVVGGVLEGVWDGLDDGARVVDVGGGHGA